jgi:alkyldihydroxyacetonephosphate synthase
VETRALKWWGWGWEDKAVALQARPALVHFLERRLKIDLPATLAPAHPDRIAPPPSLLSPDELVEIQRVVGEKNVSVDDVDRLSHATGKSYRDLIRLRSGRIERAPDAVVSPEDEKSIAQLLAFAGRRHYAIIPFGGGTSVVGGVDPPGGFPATIALDLGRMRRVLEIDPESGLVTAEPGIRGPALEEALRRDGLTLGHFPQSWEFSTLGGWIATRAAGGLSNRYGRIDQLLVGVRLVAPTRVLNIRPFPNESHGPDLKELILGSEGTLGVITQATLRAHPLPKVRRFATRLFGSFAEGAAALHALARDRALPDMAYLSDEEETRFAAASAGISPGGSGLAARKLAHASLFLMGFEGTATDVGYRRRSALQRLPRSLSLGPRPAERWYAERFELPYLRDSLLDHRILVDTVETAASWSNLLNVYEAGRKALHEGLIKEGSEGLVLCHISHAYLDGASLYFTFLAPQRVGREIEQWEAAKAAVTQAFVTAGGALSHHHGIGLDHAPYLPRVIGEDGIVVLRALKRELDPDGIMNPGKLLAGSA